MCSKRWQTDKKGLSECRWRRPNLELRCWAKVGSVACFACTARSSLLVCPDMQVGALTLLLTSGSHCVRSTYTTRGAVVGFAGVCLQQVGGHC